MLADLEVGYAIVGGLAVAARAQPRLTEDVDVAMDVADDRAAESVVQAISGRGYTVKTIIEQTRTGRLATVRFLEPGADVIVDVLFASSGIEPEIARAATRIEILPGLDAPVALAAHLVAMKLLARDDRERPQDWDDLHALVPLLDASDRKRVVEALTLIRKRGFARGRDLMAAWRQVSKWRQRST